MVRGSSVFAAVVFAAGAGWLWLVPKLTQPGGPRAAAEALGLAGPVPRIVVEDAPLAFAECGQADLFSSWNGVVTAKGVPSGAVVAVSPGAGTAVVNLGADSGVRIGQRFLFTRGGAYVGDARVESVQKGWSVVRWEASLPALQVGDEGAFNHYVR